MVQCTQYICVIELNEYLSAKCGRNNPWRSAQNLLDRFPVSSPGFGARRGTKVRENNVRVTHKNITKFNDMR